MNKFLAFALMGLSMILATPSLAASRLYKNELVNISCSYDLAASGAGTVGTHAVCNLPDNFVISEAIVQIPSALTGGGTLVVGEDGGGDADGYWTDLDAVTGSLKGSGALVASNISYKIASAKDGVQITIGSTPYTAGKLYFNFIGFQGE